MATFVVSAESQIASGQTQRAPSRRGYGFACSLVSVLTLFAIAVQGYHPFAEDGGLYVAGIKRLLDPELYPRSAEFVLEPMRFSLFAPAVAALVRATPLASEDQLHAALPIALLVLHLATIWVTLFAAWMLAARCWPAREARAGAVVLLACWLGLPVAGTALLLMDPYLTARSLATPCMVLALVGALDMTAPPGLGAAAERPRRRGFALWLGSVVVATAMHPLMAAYTLGASLMLLCARARPARQRIWGMAALCVAAVSLAAALQASARPESAGYVRVALTRSYWFLGEWRWFEVAGLAAPLVILGWFGGGRSWHGSPPFHRDSAAMDGARERTVSHTHISEERRGAPATVVWDGERALARTVVVVGATAVVVALALARAGAATHLVARMQPLRAFQAVYLAMTLMLGAWLGEGVLQRRVWRWGLALAALGVPMLIAAHATYPASRHLEMPWLPVRNPWVQAFLWVRANTPKDALFALDPGYIGAAGEDAQCFRAIAERGALADYSKDGGEASIAPELTEQWQRAQAAQQGLHIPHKIGAEGLAQLRRLGVSWVVLDSGVATGLDCRYRNWAVAVCPVP